MDDIKKLIMDQLTAYKTDVVSRIADAAQKNSKKLQKEIKVRSPVLTGDYKKGWSVDKINNSRYRVYNATDWQLTHLLEEGHYINGGTYYVPPIPHIQPARDKIEKEFITEVEDAIKNGN